MRALTITLGFTLVPVYASAQIGNPAGLAPDTKMEKPGVLAPNQTNYQDRLFAQLVGEGGLAEVDLGKLAADKTGHNDVKRFANLMVDDHGKSNDMLRSIADKSKMPLPDAINADHKKMRSDLKKLTGAQFDLAYITGQIVDHQKTALLLAWEIDQGEDAEMQRFAADTLPVVLEHLEMARLVQAKLASEKASEPQAVKN
jgi:putative membrane protein